MIRARKGADGGISNENDMRNFQTPLSSKNPISNLQPTKSAVAGGSTGLSLKGKPLGELSKNLIANQIHPKSGGKAKPLGQWSKQTLSSKQNRIQMQVQPSKPKLNNIVPLKATTSTTKDDDNEDNYPPIETMNIPKYDFSHCFEFMPTEEEQKYIASIKHGENEEVVVYKDLCESWTFSDDENQFDVDVETEA